MESAGDERLAEYLCTLQPCEGSQLGSELRTGRRSCALQLGSDEASLYPPHVSVTGFFRATRHQAAQLRSLLVDLVAAGAGTTGFHIEGRKIVLASNGHVLIDIHAPEVAELAQAFACKAANHGVHVRPKDVRHLSLASGRSAEEQVRVQELFSGVPFGQYGMDLVLARLIRRATPAQRGANTTVHQFSEGLRLPLVARAHHGATCMSQIDVEVGNVSTPSKKRGQASHPHGGPKHSAEKASLAGAADEDLTPAKIAKTNAASTASRRAGYGEALAACAG